MKFRSLKFTPEDDLEREHTGNWQVSEASKQNLETAIELLRDKRVDEGRRYLVMAMKDSRNLEPWTRAACLTNHGEESLAILLHAEKQGRRLLEQDFGPGCLNRTPGEGGILGQCWIIPETRPYMRVLHAIVDCHLCTRRYDEALNAVLWMLKLDVQDSLCQHNHIPSLMILNGQVREALSCTQAWIKDEDMYVDMDNLANPVWRPLSDEQVEKYSTGDYPAEHFYSAALASFLYRGNSMNARQYLYIAARLNPHVLLRVLAKIEQPRQAKRWTRGRNSLEDAHDYLCIVQEAWNRPDVWEWANSREDAKQFCMKMCSREGCRKREQSLVQFKRCSKCRAVVYCTKNCQTTDWSAHKPACQRAQEEKQIRKEEAKKRTA